MKVIYAQDQKHLLRFDTGEEVLALLEEYLDKENIHAGALWGIGAAGKVVLAWYDIEKKQYEDHEIEDRLEIVALHGNVALKDGKPFVHAHGSFSDRKLQTISGHIKNLTTSATTEIYLQGLKGETKRSPDEQTGLHLLS